MTIIERSYRILVPALGCMLWISSSNAQIRVLPDSAAIWNYREYDAFNTFDYRQTFLLPSIGVDTLINGTSYRPLNWYWESEMWPGSFGGGLREDGFGKVYFYSPYHDTEYLLYDLDVQPGDTVTNLWIGYPHSSTPILYSTNVVSRDTLNINGVARRSIGIRLSSDPGPAVHYWVEGIGGSAGLMSTAGANALDVIFGLECMSSNDTVWWAWGPVGAPGHCSPASVPDLGALQPVVAPNPGTGLFTLLGQAVPSQVMVFDPQGREVLHTRDRTIDLAGHVPGLYTAVVTTAQGRQAVRLVLVR